jgi:ComF family protein
MGLNQIISNITSPLVDFLYPPVCLVCQELLPNGTEKVCTPCWSIISPVWKDLPLYQETRTKLLAEGNIHDLVSCFVFEKEGPFQHIAHALKYKEYTSLGVELGKRLGKVMKDWNLEVDIIIPVPLHPIKQRERGYNQSDFIARGIASILGKPVLSNIVRRIRHTQTQTKLNIEQRQKNMEAAFETLPDTRRVVHGKRCLLVDDVITTGATTNSCAKTILAEGAASIIAGSAALAR